MDLGRRSRETISCAHLVGLFRGKPLLYLFDTRLFRSSLAVWPQPDASAARLGVYRPLQ